MKVNLPVKPRLSSYRQILEDIPAINIFETDFNAFVVGKTAFLDIPCVCYYSTFISFSPVFVDLILWSIIDKDKQGIYVTKNKKYINKDALHKNLPIKLLVRIYLDFVDTSKILFYKRTNGSVT